MTIEEKRQEVRGFVSEEELSAEVCDFIIELQDADEENTAALNEAVQSLKFGADTIGLNKKACRNALDVVCGMRS